MIKQLQLRGISRTPSDRMSADGGLSESLNIQLDDQESAPAPFPENVQETMTDELGRRLFPYSSTDPGITIVYIHKGLTFIRCIYTALGSIYWYNGSLENPGMFFSLGSGETFVRCVGLGKSLCIITSKRNEWFVFKDGIYKPLITNIPFPQIYVKETDVYIEPRPGLIFMSELSHGWNDRLTPGNSLQRKDITTILEELNFRNGLFRSNEKVLTSQKLFVIALRLADGTRICSTPVLTPSGIEQPYILEYNAYDTSVKAVVKYQFTAYRVHLRMYEDAHFFDGLEDVVDGIEVYMSQDLDSYLPTDKAYGYDFETGVDSGVNYVKAKIRLGRRSKPLEEALSEVDNFYLVKSFTLDADSITDLRNGVILSDEIAILDEDLVNRQRLPSLSQWDRYSIFFDNATSYNNKAITSGVRRALRFPQTQLADSSFASPATTNGAFFFFVHVRDDNGMESVVQMTYHGQGYVPTSSAVVDFTYYGMLFFPDKRAFAVDVYYQSDMGVDSFQWGTLPLQEHPHLEMAFWYGDAGATLESFLTQTATALPQGIPSESLEDLPNKVFVSAMDAPWAFPVGSRYTFTGKVIGTAVATAPLSPGQAGQYPMYVFTSDGIWAFETGADGSFLNPKPGPREICVDAKTITPMENAVVFVTDRAVMMISGLQVTELSPFMNGRHFTLDSQSEEYGIIAGSTDWSPLLGSLTDETHFMAYAKGARIAYDYPGARLILAKEDEDYMYVYMFRSQSWHKAVIDDRSNLRVKDILSVYPDAYARVSEPLSQYSSIFRLSTVVDVIGSAERKGVIITRPFDLGEPTIRKAIRDIRIVGQFAAGHVKYILLGSFDGLSWKRLPSLRGGSYKMFRLILLCSLAPTERISWINVDYESRFKNKLR